VKKATYLLVLVGLAVAVPAVSSAQVAGSTVLGVSVAGFRDVTLGWSAVISTEQRVNADGLQAGIPQLTEVVGAIEHKVGRRFEVPPLLPWSTRSRRTAYGLSKNLCGLKGARHLAYPNMNPQTVTFHTFRRIWATAKSLRRTEHQGPVANHICGSGRTTIGVLNARQASVNARVALVTGQHDAPLASLLGFSVCPPLGVYDRRVRDAWISVLRALVGVPRRAEHLGQYGPDYLDEGTCLKG
jgi:hypothetical protein